MSFSIAPGSAALSALAGAASGQTWRQRIREAAWTSPSGTRFRFEYFDVSREVDLRTRDYNFPGVNNGYVQQNGYGSRRYPMTCMFWGDQHDLIADSFLAGLLEPGVSKLEHPRYGTITVAPFGTIRQLDNLKTAQNQSIVEVTFWTTTGAIYPSTGADAQNEILAAIAGFDAAAAQQFSDGLSLPSPVEQQNLIATIQKQIDEVGDALGEIASTVTTVNNSFQDLEALINGGISTLIGQPLLLAQQISNLVKAPGKAFTAIGDRLDAYANLAGRIFGSSAGDPATSLGVSSNALGERKLRISNDFQSSDLFASSAVAGAINAAIGTPVGAPAPDRNNPFVGKTFATKPQALAAAERIFAQLDALVAWRDAGFEALGEAGGVSAGQVDTGASYAALKRAAALTAGSLLESSFNLATERSVVLDRNRTIVDLCAELYGRVDSRLDFLIETNELTGSDIIELPAGREVKYYTEAA